MPKYYVLEKSFINHTIAEVGEIVEYDGEPGSNLELVVETKPAAPKKGGAAKSQDDAKDLV